MAKKKKITKKKLPLKNKALKKNVKKKMPVKKASAKKVAPKKVAPKKTKVSKATIVVQKIQKTKSKEQNKPVRKSSPGGLPDQLLEAALKVLDERQAEDIFTVELAGKSSMADYLIIASGRASRQISAIAHYLKEAFEKLGVSQIRVEGVQEGNWVLIDAGDVIIHLFRPEVRRYYNLESIWTKGGGHGARA